MNSSLVVLAPEGYSSLFSTARTRLRVFFVPLLSSSKGLSESEKLKNRQDYKHDVVVSFDSSELDISNSKACMLLALMGIQVC